MALRGRLGRYRLVRRLAVGGMAEVYLSVAEGLSGFEKRVVVKRLLPQHARDGELLAMFLDEARLVATLKHPNIGEVYDVGAEDGEYFFAMEYIAGRDLRDLLVASQGPLPVAEALVIVTGVADGLHHAHEQRDDEGRLLEIVHRDVSPSNVLVSAAGQVKLVDFGVAKWASQRSETRHGVLKGKCAYMSPEQCRAEPLDRRSDVFSLGVLLYEITTGRRPFEGDNDFETMTAIVAGTFVPPSIHISTYPPALEAIVKRALAPRREDRYPTARSLSEDLVAHARGASHLGSSESISTLLARLFGDEAAVGGMAEPADRTEPPSRADTRPARPSLDRTATDHQSPATISPLVPYHLVPAESSEEMRTASPRRLGFYAGLGLACIAVVLVVSWPQDRLAPPSVAAPPSGRPAVSGSEKRLAPAPAIVPPVPVPAPVGPAPSGPAADRAPPPGVAPAVGAPGVARRVRAAKRPAQPAPAMKVWDPDSPVPPPP